MERIVGVSGHRSEIYSTSNIMSTEFGSRCKLLKSYNTFLHTSNIPLYYQTHTDPVRHSTQKENDLRNREGCYKEIRRKM